jgi:hypothetical protein
LSHSRCSIRHIGRRRELPNSPYVHLPAQSRKRGLPAIGFKVVAPEQVLFSPTDPNGLQTGVLLEAIERRADGKPVGMMEIAAFAAALVIDRDGVLQETAAAGAEQLISPPADGRLVSIGAVQYPGGAGFRADVVVSRDATGAAPPALPYVAAIAVAANDFTVSAGLYVVVRSLTAEWEAGAAMLESLTFLR